MRPLPLRLLALVQADLADALAQLALNKKAATLPPTRTSKRYREVASSLANSLVEPAFKVGWGCPTCGAWLKQQQPTNTPSRCGCPFLQCCSCELERDTHNLA